MNTAHHSSVFATAIVAGVVAMLGSSRVLAQLEEIVVTSRKLEENLQDVPLAITALTADQIESARIENLDDVAAFTPGLSFFNPIGEFLPVPVIRGVAPTDIFGETNAAIFVDGVYVSGREGLNFNFLDTERIEVMKGPQSALYGRNAFSGAINYVTKRPSDEYFVEAEATGGSESRSLGRITASGPLLGDWLKGRVGFAYDNWDGSYDDPFGGVDVGGYEYRTYQGALLIEPTETLSVWAQIYHSNDEIDEAAITSLTANCEDVASDGSGRLANYCGELLPVGFFSDQLNARYPQLSLDDNDIMKNPRSLGEDRELTRGTINIEWDVGFGTITALSGYSNTEQQALTDGTRNLGVLQPFVYCTDGQADAVAPNVGLCFPGGTDGRFTASLLQVTNPDETEEWSQELRFTSPQDRAFRYAGGGYWYTVDFEERQTGLIARQAGDPDPSTGADAVPVDWDTFAPFVVTGPGPQLTIGDGAFRDWFLNDLGDIVTPARDIRDISAKNDTEAWAIFGLVEFDFLERFTAELQARYTKEEKELHFKLVRNPNIPGVPFQRDFNDDWTYFVARGSLRYQVSDDWILYTSLSNNEKSGGFDNEITDVIVTDPTTGLEGSVEIPIVASFDSETILQGEFGAKGTTADGRLRLDLALFWTDWEDIVIPQIFTADPNSGLPFEQPEGFNTNAGDATVWGWEAQADFSLSDNLTGRVTGSWTDATFDTAILETFADFPSFAPDGDISGNTVLRQPEWQASASLTYAREWVRGWEFFARGDVIYQDEYFGGGDNQWTVPAHTYVNLNTGFRGENWSLTFWAKNLFEDDSPTGAFRDVYFGNTDDPLQLNPPVSSPNDFFPFRITVQHPRLRTWGVTAKYKFGGGQ